MHPPPHRHTTLFASEKYSQFQTRSKVEQVSRSTLLRDKVACLTRQVAELLTSHATNLLDKNHLYSLNEKVAQLCCVSDIGLRPADLLVMGINVITILHYTFATIRGDFTQKCIKCLAIGLRRGGGAYSAPRSPS